MVSQSHLSPFIGQQITAVCDCESALCKVLSGNIFKSNEVGLTLNREKHERLRRNRNTISFAALIYPTRLGVMFIVGKCYI